MEYPPTLLDYLAILERRRWYFIVPFFVILIVGGITVMLLPSTYRSSGKIGVESQQIPEEFVRSTITTHAGERVGLIEQRVMRTNRLEQIIEDLDLYSEERQHLSMDALVDKMRGAIEVDIINDPYAKRLGAIAFIVSFAHSEPKTARDVTAKLINLFLEENTKSRTDRATETTEFLEREAEKLGKRAREVDAEIAAFKQENRNALPEHIDLKTGMLDRAKSDLTSLELEILSLEEEKRFLETQRKSVAAILSSRNDPRAVSASEEQLAELKTELAAKSAEFHSIHPDIRRLQAAIEALEKQIRSKPRVLEGKTERKSTDPALTMIESQLRTTTSRLRLLQGQVPNLRAKVAQLEEQILTMPLVETKLRQLTDKYELLIQEYRERRLKKQDAELAQILEQEERAERFIELEPPHVPLDPERPVLKLIAFVFVFAAGGGGSVAYAAEYFDDNIYGSRMVASLTGELPLAVIPHITSSFETDSETPQQSLYAARLSSAPRDRDLRYNSAYKSRS